MPDKQRTQRKRVRTRLRLTNALTGALRGFNMECTIWTCGWWLTIAAVYLMEAKQRKIEGLDRMSKQDRCQVATFNLIVWIAGMVGALIFST